MSYFIDSKLAIQMSFSGKDSKKRVSVVNSFTRNGISNVVENALRLSHWVGKSTQAIREPQSTWFKHALDDSLKALFDRHNLVFTGTRRTIYELYTDEMKAEYNTYNFVHCCDEHKYDTVDCERVLRKKGIIPESEKDPATATKKTKKKR